MNREITPAEAGILSQAVESAKVGNWEKVEEACSAVSAGNLPSFRISFLLSLSAFARDDIAGAVEHAKAAFDVEPTNTQIVELLAILYALAGDTNQSTFYVKMSSVTTEDPEMKSWLPEELPSLSSAYFEARERPFLQAALTSASQGEWIQAEHWYRQHLAFHPTDVDAHIGLGNVLLIRGAVRAAIGTLRAARHVVPNDARLASMLGSALTQTGANVQGRALHDWAAERSDDPVVHATSCTDLLFDTGAAPETVIAAFRAWSKRFGVPADSFSMGRMNPNKQRLTIGYVFGSIDRQEFAPALARILAGHDPKRFRVIGFGLGRLSATFNTTFQQCVEGWLDLQGVDPQTFGSMVIAEGVDILVDVSGFVDPQILTAFGGRMAPVQLTWLGVPAGTGMAEVDGVLSDGFIDPEGVSALNEPVVRLDSGAVVVALPTSIDLCREGDDSGSGLGPVFAADVMLAELNVPTVSTWSEILRAVPNSMLLLRDYDMKTEDNVAHLIDLFGNFGVAHRIEIVTTSSGADLYKMADVGLVPFNTARLEPLVGALSVGAPIVCLAGEGRYRRRAGSLLHHLGLADGLVAADAAGYQGLAVGWATDVSRRKAFGDELEARLAKAPLSDAKGRIVEFERVYEDLWRKAASQG